MVSTSNNILNRRSKRSSTSIQHSNKESMNKNKYNYRNIDTNINKGSIENTGNL
jgi:hypothetical protein